MTIDEFMAKLSRAQEQYPRESEQALKSGANKLRRAIKANSPDSGWQHKNKLKNSWRVNIEGTSGSDLRAEIRSTSPHFHLVERGHEIKSPSGRYKGYKQGEFFLEHTLDDQGQEIEQEMGEKLLRKLRNDIE